MVITAENIYQVLEERKKDLNFRFRDDVKSEPGYSRFSTLFKDPNLGYDDIPDDILNFLETTFNTKRYDFVQIQKYEIGEYILPHRDSYPHFNLLILSQSDIDGIVVEQADGSYKFFPDVPGTMINLPAYKWHWVNPVRDKTRYTAVVGTCTKFDDINNLLSI
jgi:hypothetical protein